MRPMSLASHPRPIHPCRCACIPVRGDTRDYSCWTPFGRVSTCGDRHREPCLATAAPHPREPCSQGHREHPGGGGRKIRSTNVPQAARGAWRRSRAKWASALYRAAPRPADDCAAPMCGPRACIAGTEKSSFLVSRDCASMRRRRRWVRRQVAVWAHLWRGGSRRDAGDRLRRHRYRVLHDDCGLLPGGTR